MVDEICIDLTKACPASSRAATEKRTTSVFEVIRRGKRAAAEKVEPVTAEQLAAADTNELSKQDRAVMASKAAKATKCPLCLLLVEDLWAKVLGQGIEGKPMGTEDQIFDMIDKTCGMGGRSAHTRLQPCARAAPALPHAIPSFLILLCSCRLPALPRTAPTVAGVPSVLLLHS